MRSIDSIRINRQEKPKETLESRDTSKITRRKSQNGSFVILIVIALGIFFLITRPSADVTSSSTAPKSVSDKNISANIETRPGPPQPNAGSTLEETVILDQPLPNSEAQETPSKTEPPKPEEQVITTGFTVRILNGSGISGAAANAQKLLLSRGYNVKNIGTAVNKYSKSIIFYSVEHKTAAEFLRSSLKRDSMEIKEDSIASPADILLVVGEDGID